MAEEEGLRIVFMGTPGAAATVLRAVHGRFGKSVAAVWTMPDRPARRGHRLTPSPVKELALELGLPVIQPESFAAEADREALRAFRPDFLLVTAYGMILPDSVLSIPRFPPLNVHMSLLPRYRGAAPVQRAIMENWGAGAVSGVSVMEIVRRLDAGPVHARAEAPLAGRTSGDLLAELAETGAGLLIAVMERFLAGTAHGEEQDEAQATYAAKIRAEDAFIAWNRPAAEADARIRGVTPAPGARALFLLDGREPLLMHVGPGRVVTDGAPEPMPAGTLFRARRELLIACADAWYAPGFLRPPGKRDMEPAAFINGFLRDVDRGPCGRMGDEDPVLP